MDTVIRWAGLVLVQVVDVARGYGLVVTDGLKAAGVVAVEQRKLRHGFYHNVPLGDSLQTQIVDTINALCAEGMAQWKALVTEMTPLWIVEARAEMEAYFAAMYVEIKAEMDYEYAFRALVIDEAMTEALHDNELFDVGSALAAEIEKTLAAQTGAPVVVPA
jgi:hypothetical protein